MATVFRDDDADLGALEGRTVSILGYGNQGRSQALNLRDSGVEPLVVGSANDASAKRATAEGFPVYSYHEAAERSDVILLLVPDEVLPDLYGKDIAPTLERGDVLVFASGFNVAFGRITPPPDVDVVLLAPRMIGAGVRETYERGHGFPSLVGVEQDASGQAWPIVKALAKGIGSTRMGAVSSSCKEEAMVDLFSEQSGALYMFTLMFEALVEAGVDPDVAILEMYGSGELAQMYEAVRDMGLLGQLRLHSRTSQYGQQVVGPRSIAADAVKEGFAGVLQRISDGTFAAEWMDDQATTERRLFEAVERSLAHPMQVAENSLYRRLGRREADLGNWLG